MTGASFKEETFSFLRDLGLNNSKDWFDANKAIYQRSVKKPSDAFRSELTDALTEMSGREFASKQFRINRDLRFSKDKTPYNTHIRMAFWPKGGIFEGRDAQPPSFFLSIEQDHIRLGAGCMAFSKPVLGAYLHALEHGAGDDITVLYEKLAAHGFERSDADLVNPPRGFPKDHPDADLARHKGLCAWKTLSETGFLLEDHAAKQMAEKFRPTVDFWNYLIELHEKA